MKITIAVPGHDSVPFQFAYHLAQMCAFTAGFMPEGTTFGVLGVTGTYTHSARKQLMELAVADPELDYMLWLDSDMTFPKESLVLLMQHQLPMVGINYSTCEVGGHPVATKQIGPPGIYLATDDDSEGLEEVEGIGFGMVLLRMRDFRALADIPQPWFHQEWREEDQNWTGEDIYFSKLVREQLGHRVFVDHDLSKECGHVGQMTYRLQHLAAMQEAGV